MSDDPLTPMMFSRKPVVVEAMRYTAETCVALHAWLDIEHHVGEGYEPCGAALDLFPLLPLDSDGFVLPGAWVVRDADGEVSTYTPDEFAAIYEACDDRARRAGL